MTELIKEFAPQLRQPDWIKQVTKAMTEMNKTFHIQEIKINCDAIDFGPEITWTVTRRKQ